SWLEAALATEGGAEVAAAWAAGPTLPRDGETAGAPPPRFGWPAAEAAVRAVAGHGARPCAPGSPPAAAVTPAAAPPGAFRPSARGREVAALVARGWTNRRIADDLVLSVRTVDRHVANALARLGLESRAHLAAWAVSRGIPGAIG